MRNRVAWLVLVIAMALASSVAGTTAKASGSQAANAAGAEATPGSRGSLAPYTAPFAPDADYDPAVPTLESLLGFIPGSRPASPDEIERCFRALVPASPRVRLNEIGRTHEGRLLFHAIVGSPENLARLDAIEQELAEVADGHAAARANPSAATTPAYLPVVIWIGASVHGDEASGADAALALLYHYAADRGERTRSVLENAILLIDPMQNPDGRAHFMTDVQQWGGSVPCLDPQSIQHRAGWPTGRGNHYFLDLNRDWFVLSQPETRAIVGAILRFRPQVTIDLHEMGSADTYLMSPPRFPINPNVPARTREWWRRFSLAQAQAFGERGWSCYTGDWNEEFSPNRGASWTLHTGAVAILEEQAGTDGGAFERPDGSVLQYREAVHHHFVATRAVIETAAAARRDILRDYAMNRREARSAPRSDAIRAYVIPADGIGAGRARRLVETLRRQGIDVKRTSEALRLPRAMSYWGESRGEKPFVAGSYVIDLEQPEGRLARAILDFDPPLGSEFLTEERRRLEANEPSLLYDASAWCLGMAYGVDVFAVKEGWPASLRTTGDVGVTGGVGITGAGGGTIIRPEASFGFLIDAAGEGAPEALAALLAGGISLWASDAPFSVAGRDYPSGSVLVKRADGGADLRKRLEQIATRTGARFVGIDTALSDSGPDLGSRHFHLLQAPRAAILAGSPFFESTFGALWHLFDVDLDLPVSLLRLGGISPESDLDRYNVLIVPDAAPGKGAGLLSAITPEGFQALADWVRRGGTLITLGEGNWLLFGGIPPFTSLRAQQQVLPELAQYREAAIQEMAVRTARVDEDALRRAGGSSAASVNAVTAGRAAPAASAVGAAPAVTPERDEWLRRFCPPGTILRADLNKDHWLCAGVGDRVPVMVKTDLALRSRQPIETVGRFADAGAVRLSGLLWPEARDRWALSSYLAREKIGNGQVISFLGNPYFRLTFMGTGRLLENAILLGPGMGAKAR